MKYETNLTSIINTKQQQKYYDKKYSINGRDRQEVSPWKADSFSSNVKLGERHRLWNFNTSWLRRRVIWIDHLVETLLFFLYIVYVCVCIYIKVKALRFTFKKINLHKKEIQLDSWSLKIFFSYIHISFCYY